ncbi:MAG: hypothetical protein K8R90_01705 [Candidatus Cloacimonetes bacterium]|nr:hypothetical protein [Candidatus Cloacimonadota bacterium]
MIFLSLILAGLVAWWFYRRTVPGVSRPRRLLLLCLRIITLWVLIMLLLNPVLRREGERHQKPVVWLLRDVSLSMSQPAAGLDKAGLFEPALEQTLSQLRRSGFEPVELSFAAGLTFGGDSLDIQSTRLADALAQAAEIHGTDHLSRVVLFSDGWLKDTRPDDALELGVPLDAWLPAWQDTTFDLRLTRLHAPDEVFVGEEAPLAVDMTAQGYTGDARLTVYVNDRSVAARTIDFSTGAHQRIELAVALDKPGLHTLEARLTASEHAPDEPDTGNNALPVALHVRNNHPQARILCDRPDWDTALLLQGIGRLPGWEAAVWQADRGRWRHGPRRVALTSLLDDSTRLLVLLNHGDLRFAGEDVSRIERFVENGGGLLLLGAHITELRDLLPGGSSNIRQWFESSLLLTPEARRYETFRRLHGIERDIPPLDYRYVTASAGAETLAAAVNPEQSPLALTWRRGEGRVLWLACLGWWRWQLWGEQDACFAFMGDVANWLGHPAAQRFAAFTDRAGYRLGEPVRLRLHAFDERMNRQRDLQPQAVVLDSTGIERASGYLHADDDGVYALRLDDLPAGRYRYSITDERTGQHAEGDFAVAGIGSEQQDRGINRSMLAWLAQRSGGTLHTDSLSAWPAAEPIAIAWHSELALYKKWYIIALFLIAFGLELFLRKRWGLL